MNKVLDPSEKAMIEKRERLLAKWPIAGVAMFLLILGLTAWLVFFSPLLANPFHVMSQLEADAIPKSSLVLMAGILPIMTLATLVLLLALIFFAWISVKREAEYIKIIRRISSE